MRDGMLTEPGKASASIAKSNKQQAGACLYQEKKSEKLMITYQSPIFILSEFLPGFTKKKDQDRK